VWFVSAMSVGMVVHCFVLMQLIAEMTRLTDATDHRKITDGANSAQGWRIIKINGPLYFAAADRVFSRLSQMSKEHKGLVLYLDAVPLLDAGGLNAFMHFVEQAQQHNVELIIADLQFQPLRTL